MRHGSLVEEDIAAHARTERDAIKRSAFVIDPGWGQFLDGLSDPMREIALRPLLPGSTFERWRILTNLLSRR